MHSTTLLSVLLPAVVLAQTGTTTVVSTISNPVTVTSTASGATTTPVSLTFNTSDVTGFMTAFDPSSAANSTMIMTGSSSASRSSVSSVASSVSSVASSLSSVASSASSVAASATRTGDAGAILPNVGGLIVAAVMALL